MVIIPDQTEPLIRTKLTRYESYYSIRYANRNVALNSFKTAH
jgi:hypothetical protein